MLSISSFIELAGFEHAKLFDGCQYYWEAVKLLPEYLENIVKRDIRGDVHPNCDIEGAVFIGEGTTVEIGARITGPAYIGKKCRIRANAYLDRNIIFGKGIDFGHCSNAYNSVLMDGTVVFPMNILGASIIGTGCVFSSGCMLHSLNLGREEIVIRVPPNEHQTGLHNLGAIVGHHSKLGGGVTSAPGTLIGPHSNMYTHAFLRGYYPPKSVVRTEQNR